MNSEASWLARHTNEILMWVAVIGGIVGGVILLALPVLPGFPELRLLVGFFAGAVAGVCFFAVAIDTFEELAEKYSPSRALRRQREREEINRRIARSLFGWQRDTTCDGRIEGSPTPGLTSGIALTPELMTRFADLDESRRSIDRELRTFSGFDGYCAKCHQKNLGAIWLEHPVLPLSFCTSADAMARLIERLSDVKVRIYVGSNPEALRGAVIYRCTISSTLTPVTVIGRARVLQEAIARAAADFAESELETIRLLFEPPHDEQFWLSEIRELVEKIEATGSASAKQRLNDQREGPRRKLMDLEFALTRLRGDSELNADRELTPKLITRFADLDKSRRSIDRELRILKAYGYDPDADD
jgi:hypothetical protein